MTSTMARAPASQLRLAVVQRLDRSVARVVDNLFTLRMRRIFDQPSAGVFDTVGHLLGEIGQPPRRLG